MAKFRKKPVEIEAFQMTANDTGENWPQWLKDAWSSDILFILEGQYAIRTLEGNHLVTPDDWIIQGVQGELYPCKPDIFVATYDPVGG